MASGDTFQDPSLKQALVREAERIEVNSSLLASVEGLFAEAEAPAPLQMPRAATKSYRNRFFLLAAAVVVAGLSVAFLTTRESHSDWDEEYTISESRLWPAMASLYRPGTPATNPAALAVADNLVLTDARYQLLASRDDTLEGYPCVVRDYRRDDGAVFSVITTPASNLVHESHLHEEEEDETYDQRVGEMRIVGGIKGDYWICVAAPATVPEDVFKDVLGRMPTVEK